MRVREKSDGDKGNQIFSKKIWTEDDGEGQLEI